jgi:hypothetical protein
MDSYITRLCWSENHWTKPSGSAAKLETDTFNTRYGFGFEGWRYGFVQGVNKSIRKLSGEVINLYLFTIDAERQRKYVAELAKCHVLTANEAETTYRSMKRSGLIDQMVSDIRAVSGNPIYILDESVRKKGTLEIINLRFRAEGLSVYDKLIDVPQHSKIWGYNRYQAIKAPPEELRMWV